MTFQYALNELQNNNRVRREGWNNTEAFLKIEEPGYSRMTHPYIYIQYPEGSKAYPDGMRVPWSPSQTDILAEDWMVVE